MDIEQALPQLVGAYDAGLLVPFIGAGMSTPATPGWGAFVANLEIEAASEDGGSSGQRSTGDPAALVRRANRAVRVLKRREKPSFPKAVRQALYATKHGQVVPEQTRALTALWWPLVLTTNYDDVFCRAYAEAHPKERDHLAVYGRSPQDCQAILSSLNAPTACLMWALQGHLPRHPSTDTTVAALEDELVVGHEEYRRVTHAVPHFRRAFTEVFRRRSLLFLGSGLSESYLLELFGETLETYGANPVPHFATVLRGTVDVDFLKSRLNTIVLEYDSHDDLPRWLKRFSEAWKEPRPRQVRWGFSLTAGHTIGDAAENFAIVRSALPYPGVGECVAVSAGRDEGRLLFGPSMSRYLTNATARGLISGGAGHGLSPRATWVHPLGEANAGRNGSPIAAVVARGESDYKDLRVIGTAVEAALEWAAGRGDGHLHMQLLASGPTAHFPARYSLTETARAFARWNDANPSAALQLSLHVTDPGVLFELATGRIDMLDVFRSATSRDIRFWVQVTDGTRVLDRELMLAPDSQVIDDLARQFDIPPSGWTVSVTPLPRRKAMRQSVASARHVDLRSLGVLTGSTLHFESK
jgi:SIR2-like domain